MRITRTRPLPYRFLISGTLRASSSAGFCGTMVARYGPIMSNVRAIEQGTLGQALGQASGTDLVEVRTGRGAHAWGASHDHDHRNPRRRPDAADATAVGARPPARAGHVCGAVAVPLIIGRALKLAPEDVAFLISADLFACGLATLVQCIGFPAVGIRLPVMMGVTFASVGPMLSMAAAPDIGLLGIYGSVIAAGIFGILAAPFISRLLPLFPPVVT